ncbi:MAG: hypothetical protein HYY06_22750 [Deltaproteobacteria bacterium]|nr:hypothetical protein [Deltaproteobacteria bacterium]
MLTRRELIRILGSSAAAAAAGLSIGACTSKKLRPRSAEEAKKTIARAIFGAELATHGERLIERARLDEDEREQLAGLTRLARTGAALDRSAMEDHEAVVKRLLRDFWSDEDLLWHAVGYPNGPGVCTEFDLYTRPPVEAHYQQRSARKKKRSHG